MAIFKCKQGGLDKWERVKKNCCIPFLNNNSQTKLYLYKQGGIKLEQFPAPSPGVKISPGKIEAKNACCI